MLPKQMDEKPIILEDNNYKDREDDHLLSEAEAKKLSRYEGRCLNELCAKNPSLLLFPDCLGDNGDDIKEPLYTIQGNERNGRRLKVGNIVGFWGVKGVNVRVHSRFDVESRQYFFHYLLQRIAGVNALDLKTLPDAEDMWDFLIYMFPMALKRAVNQGIFRAYHVFRYDDDRVKGVIDAPRFIRQDVPFRGRIAYTTREHTANNHVIQLVRHTIEFIRRKAPVLLNTDSEMRQAVETIVQITPDYSDKARARIIAANLRPVRHPYYSAYTVLQKLCLQILRHKKLSFGESDGSICGIVFDAAWLWEEYLNKVFETDVNSSAIVHPRNKMKTDPVFFFRNNKKAVFYPDFHDPRRKMVLDAKYKRENGLDRNDLFQLISYLHVLEYRFGILLKPGTRTDYSLNEVLNNTVGERIVVCTMRVPRIDPNQKFKSFVSAIQGEEEAFKEIINELCGHESH